MLSKITALNNLIASLADRPNTALNSTELKQYFDSQPEQIRVAFNALIDGLLSTTALDSGAKNIGVSPITNVTGTNIQAVLEDLKVQINGTVAGTVPDGSITQPKLSSDVVQKLVPYGGSTTNAGNAYSLAYPITSLVTGMAISLQINADSTGATTLNWDGKGAKPIKKPNGLNSTTLKAGGIYTLRYNGTNFILQGEGGEYGNATAADVVESKTIGTDTGLVTGTMLNFAGQTLTYSPDALTYLTEVDPSDPNYRVNITVQNAGTNGKIDPTTDIKVSVWGIAPQFVKMGQPIGKWDSTLVGTMPLINPGDFLVNSNDINKQTTATSYTKVKETSVTAAGVYRVKFDLTTPSASFAAYAQIYVNGVPRGTERSTTSTSPVTYSEDITVQANDLIQIYAKSSGGGANADVRNFRLCVTTMSFTNPL